MSRFSFELHPELDFEQYQLSVKPNDPVVIVHVQHVPVFELRAFRTTPAVNSILYRFLGNVIELMLEVFAFRIHSRVVIVPITLNLRWDTFGTFASSASGFFNYHQAKGHESKKATVCDADMVVVIVLM